MLTSTLCAALSAAGLAVALLTAYRRRFRRATRIAAVAMLPVGLAMSGLLELGGRIGAAVADWAADLVLRPTVWAGFGALAVSAVLFLGARIAGRRAGARGARSDGAGGRRAVPAPGAPAASLGRGRSAAGSGPSGKAGAKPGAKSSSSGLEDFADIEEILKKHGI